MPRFENRGDFVFENVADGNPYSVLLGRNQLDQGMLERLRKFLPRNVCVRYVRPSKVLVQDSEKDSNGLQQLRQVCTSLVLLTILQEPNDFAGCIYRALQLLIQFL